MLISRIVVIINKNSRERSINIFFIFFSYKRKLTFRQYLIARDEILEFIKNELLRKYSSRMFSLINKRKLENRKQLYDRS